MTIAAGDTLPDATLVHMGAEGPAPVQMADKVKGRKVVIFAVPGAFTPTCHSAHVPSFDFDAPPAGLIGRANRYALLVDDGKVSVLQAEENPGVCDVSGGEALLESI